MPEPFQVGDLIESCNHEAHNRRYDGWIGTYTRCVPHPDGDVYKFILTRHNPDGDRDVGYEATFLLENLRLVKRARPSESDLLFN